MPTHDHGVEQHPSAQAAQRPAVRLPLVGGLPATAGNQAVAQLLSVQRDPTGPSTGTALPLADTALQRAETIRGAASARLLKVAAYNERASAAIDAFRAKRSDYDRNWGQAWGQHSGVLTRGGQQAATQNLIEGVVVGALASVVVAAAAAALFPAAAGAAIFTGTWWAFNAGTAVGSSVVGTAAMTGMSGDPSANSLGRPSVPGPTSGEHDAETDTWRSVSTLESHARAVSNAAPRFGLELGNAEYAIAQVRAHTDGGTPDQNWDHTLDMVSTLANWENGLRGFDTEIDAKLAAMAAFRDAVNAWEVPSATRLEREIWYAWMARLDDTTDEALDQDAIQDYLTAMGLLPDVFYFSDNDQHRAVAAARAHVAQATSSAPTPP